MAKPLRVLIVEDVEDDALLVIRELERGDYETTFERVETAEAMTAALEKQAWDIIISDYRLPHFSAPEALELFQQSGIDLPFIVVSGTIGEETAVETMKAGAHDYLMKGNLTRLVPAIERELHDAEVRKERKQAEELFRTLANSSPVGIYIMQGRKCRFVNLWFQKYTGYTEDELLSMESFAFVDPEDRERVRENEVEMLKGNRLSPYEFRYIGKSGETKWAMETVASIQYQGERATLGNFMDITERKLAEEALRESEKNFRNSLDVSPLGIRIVNAEGELLYGNQAILDIYGYSSIKELKTTPVKQRYTPQSYAEHLERRERRTLGKPVPASYEISIVRKDDEVRHLVGHRKEVIWDGETQFQILYQDITERKQAEEALRKRESILSESQRIGHIGSWELDIVANVLTWSDEIYRMFELEPQQFEATYEAFLDNIHPDDREMVDKAYTESIRNKTPYDIVHRLLLKDGTVKYVNERCETFYDNNGKPIRSIGMVQDITERKLAEEAVRESEENLRTYLESAPDGVYLNDLNGTFLYGNKKAEEIIGYGREELVGSSFLELDLLPGEYLEKAGKLLELNTMGRPTGPEEFELIRKDGSRVWVEINTTPTKQAEGKVVVIGFVRDITERKQAEEEIKQAAEEWRTTFDSIADLVSIHDKDFRLVRVNKAFADIFNMKPEELVGKTCYQVVHGTNECVPHCPHMKTLETREPAMADFFEPHLGIHLEVATSPIFDDKGEVMASVHIARDISERKNMQQQLILTDRLASIGELSSGIAHELNNPLTAVIGFSELLLSKDVPDDVKEDLEVINREAKRTAGVVRNLLTFARGRPEEKQLVDINEVIQNILGLRAYEQRVNNIEVDTQLASNLPEVMADGFQLQHVFLNIIINAEYFMSEAYGRGRLAITTERVGDIVRASFVDDGPGISPENLSHLFNPFFTTKEVGKGTGLGLSICHGIISAHGGKIYAESELGKGATFVIELPISQMRLIE